MLSRCCFDVALMLREDVVFMSRGRNGGPTGKRIGYKTDVKLIMHERSCFDVAGRCCFDVAGRCCFHVAGSKWETTAETYNLRIVSAT